MSLQVKLPEKRYFWVDQAANDTQNLEIQKALSNIGILFKTFSSLEVGEAAIKNLDENTRLCLVISGTFGKTLVPSIHQYQQISCILVFCAKPMEHLEWAKQYNKIYKITSNQKTLKSLLEYYHQTNSSFVYSRLNNPQENHVYSLNDLVMAGELQYTEDHMKVIAINIIKQFKDTINENYEMFLDEVLKAIMYLLKREQDLKEFVGKIRTEIKRLSRKENISQRYLVDLLLIRSVRYLHHRLLSLLSKRNPIPMCQPSLESNDRENRFHREIISLWDFERPVLLSFSIEDIQGKSRLLNELFLCSFEEQTKGDKYFRETIDLDFGYNFSERRPINIGNAHGPMSKDLLLKTSTIFSGFLIHVKENSFSQNIDTVMEYLKLLKDYQYIKLIIQDCEDSEKSPIKSSEPKLRSVCSSIEFLYLKDTNQQETEDIKEERDQLRDSIFSDIDKCKKIEKATIQQRFKLLLSNPERNILEENESFIDGIRSFLIDENDEYYPLYTKFKLMAQKKLEIAKKDPYKNNFHDKEIFQLHCESYIADHDFKDAQKAGREHCGQGFEKFFSILEDPNSRLKNLSLLGIELEHEREKCDDHLSIDIHWRNALINYNNLTEADRRVLFDAYRDYILDGNPFEIIDGDNFQMHIDILKTIFDLLPDKNIFVVTVVGPQNSGKSTLMNFLFGTSFEVRNGRCTKGMYGTFLSANRAKKTESLLALEYDYIFVIDTEGISSAEKGDDEYSKRLLLFSLAVSHLVIINNGDEVNETTKKMITICIQSLTYLETARVTHPAVHIILNKRDQFDPKTVQNLFEIINGRLQDNKLDKLVDLQKENIHELTTIFKKVSISVLNKIYTSTSVDENFITGTQKLGRIFIDKSSEIVKNNDDQFCIPSKWIEYAGQVFTVIKRHPDISEFQEIYEREVFGKLRAKGREILKSRLSVEQCKNFIEQNKSKTHEEIKKSFEDKKSILSTEFYEELDRHSKICKISDVSYKRLKGLFGVQINNRIRSWEASAILVSDRYKLEKTMETCERRIREKLSILTLKDCPSEKSSMRQYLEDQVKELIPKIEENLNLKDLWNNAMTLVSYLWIISQVDHLPTIADLLNHLTFLESLDESNDQPVSIDTFLNCIYEKCSTMALDSHLIVGKLNNQSSKVLMEDIKSPRTFLRQEKLWEIYQEIDCQKQKSREMLRRGLGLLFFESFEKNYRDIVNYQACLKMLISTLKDAFQSSDLNDPNGQFQFAEKILNKSSEIIQQFDGELSVFDFHVSDDFRRWIYTFLVLSTIAKYYVLQKNELLKSNEEFRKNILALIDRFLPFFMVENNHDEFHAKNIVESLSKHLFSSFEGSTERLIRLDIQKNEKFLQKRSIIEDFDRRAADDETESNWVIKYLTNPIAVISQEFSVREKFVIEDARKQADSMKNDYLATYKDFLTLIQSVNKRLDEEGGSKINFVNELFTGNDQKNDENTNLSNKRLAMASLLHNYFSGQPIVEDITINGQIYKVNPLWSEKIAVSNVSTNMQRLFQLTNMEWENIEIVHPVRFLEKLIEFSSTSVDEMEKNLMNIIDRNCTNSLEIYRRDFNRCKAVCPCCQRICDFNHDSDIRIGDKGNEHRCELGHQMRGLGGAYFEMTGEASLLRCQFLSDEDIVKISNKRETWKNFKQRHSAWSFPSIKSEILESDIYSVIWKRIGNDVCDHYNKIYGCQKMKFVTQNSPMPINHFIFLLDHSGSMDEVFMSPPTESFNTHVSLNNSGDDNREESLTPWQHLLRAIEVFIAIRLQLHSLSDRITCIIFGNRAKTVSKQRPLDFGILEDLNIPTSVCGGGTNYKVALEEVLKVLNDLKQDPQVKQLHQTIIFMTDGEPQEYGGAVLNHLSTYKADSADISSDKPLIHRFWTMGLGKVNENILEQINEKMGGKLVNIEHATELEHAYAKIAEILPTDYSIGQIHET